MIRPYLCSDPYCPQCGDPGAVYWEAAMERLERDMAEKKIDEIEFEIFISVGFAAVDAHREAMRYKL